MFVFLRKTAFVEGQPAEFCLRTKCVWGCDVKCNLAAFEGIENESFLSRLSFLGYFESIWCGDARKTICII